MRRRIANILLIFFVGCFLSGTGFAQDWVKKMSDPTVNFYEVQQSFNAYWEGREVSKGSGWKPFKRWEAFMEPRVYPTGERFDPAQAPLAFQEYRASHQPAIESAASWSALGPYTWNTVSYNPGNGRVNATAVDPNDANTIYVGTPAGGFWKSTDGGATWATTTDDQTVLGVSAIGVHPTDSDIIYIGTGDGDGGDTYSVGVLKSVDGGDTWNPTGLNWIVTQFRRISKILVHPTTPNTVLAATSNGVYRSTDAGASWTQTQSGNFKDMEFKPGDPSIVYVCGTTFYRSTDGGASFSQVTSGVPAGVNRLAIAVTPANSDYVYLLGGSSSDSGFEGLYRSTNSGASFFTRSTSPNILGYATNGSSSGGQSWYDLAIAASPTNAEEIYAGGINIWKSTNGGSTWTINAYWYWFNTSIPYVHADIHALDFHGNTLFAGCDGGIFNTTNGGTNWTDISAGIANTQFYRMGGYPADENLIIAGSQDNGTNRYNGSWTHVLGADGMEAMIDYNNPDVMYCAIQNGGLRRSTDGGNSFSNITSGISGSGAWVTPFIMDPVNSNIIYAGFEDVWKSTNQGTSWSSISSFPGSSTLRSLAIAPSDNNYIYTATESLIYRTTNGGTSWTNVASGLPGESITYIAISSTDPEKIWVTFSGYSSGEKVYTSTNGGASWTNYSGSLPNLPFNCVTYHNSGNDAVYVGGDVGVYYRNSSLSDWQLFSTNLPNVIVQEMEVHETSGKLRAATFGRGMWESTLQDVLDPPEIAVTPASVSVTVMEGATGNTTVNIANVASSSADNLSWTMSKQEATALRISDGRNISTRNIEKNKQDRPNTPRLPKGAPDVWQGSPVTEGSGGPDAFGYTWIDSDEAGGPTYAWQDISGVGTATSFSDDDLITVPLPFTFPFYGADYTSLTIGSNGLMGVSAADIDEYFNQDFPDSDTPNNAIALFWDDLNPTNGGTVYYYDDSANNQFIVQYEGVAMFNGSGNATCQAILRPDGSILYQYESLTGTLTSATVGIENADGSDALQVVYNSAYLKDDLAIEISPPTPPCPWLSFSPGSGNLAFGTNEDVSLTLDATDLTVGTYNCELVIDSNDPANSQVTVPITLTVTSVSPIVISAPDTLEGNAGGNVDVPIYLTVGSSNVGALGVALKATNSMLTYTGFTTGPIVPGATFNVNSPASDSARIAFFNSGGGNISSDGLLATLHFTIDGGATQGQTSDIVFSNFIASDPLGTPFSTTNDSGLVTANALASISGRFLYSTTGGSGDPAKPISGINVRLSHNSSYMDTVQTNASGDYTLPSIAYGSNYQVDAFAPNGGLNGAINPADALMTFNGFLGAATLTGAQSLSADVDASDFINPADALMIFNRFLGISATFPADDWRAFPANYDIDASATAWQSAPDGLDLATLDRDTTGQDFLVLARGDVDMNWTPSAPPLSAQATHKNNENALTFKVSGSNVAPGSDIVSWQVLVEGDGLQEGLYAFGADLLFDAKMLAVQAVKWEKIVPNPDYQLGHNLLLAEPETEKIAEDELLEGLAGRLRFGGFATGAKGIEKNGVLVTIEARLLKDLDPGILLPLQITNISAAIGAPVSGSLAKGGSKVAFTSLQATGINGAIEISAIPGEFALGNNYPNPFNPVTHIQYQLPKASQVRLIVYNTLGQKIRTLVNANAQAAGFYEAEWNGLNDAGETVSSGIYFYRIEAHAEGESFVRSGKMMHLK